MTNNTVLQGGRGGIPIWMEILFSENGMKASLLLKSGDEAQFYTLQNVKENLRKAGIQAPLKEDVIDRMITERMYDEFFPVAEGEEPKQGRDGYYEYFFDTNAQTGIPRILEDGTVDYSQIIELVEEGDVVAKYHRSRKGKNGYKVTGEVIRPKEVHDEYPLRISGVTKENGKYIARSAGRVTLRNNFLEVDPALYIMGDVNNAYGNVRFNGDVFVKGDVRSGMIIDAKGSVIIDGTVEGARLTAGKDIIIGYGVHGKGKAIIELSGDLACNFIEGAVVFAKGRVVTGSIVNSDVHADQDVDVTVEDKGVIMGGIVCGMAGVKANVAGHRTGIHTEIYAGASKKDTAAIHKLQRYNRSNLSYSKRILAEESQLFKEMKKAGDTVRGEQVKKKLKVVMDEKVQLDINLGKSSLELEQIFQKISYANDAEIVINYQIFEGVDVILGTIKAEIPEDIEGVRFVRDGINVDVRPFVKARKNPADKPF